MGKIRQIILVDECIVNDDDDIICPNTEYILQKTDIAEEVKQFMSTTAALNYLKECNHLRNFPEWVMVDDNIPEVERTRFMQDLKDNFPDREIYLIGLKSENKDSIVSLSEFGVHELINKPLRVESINSIYKKYVDGVEVKKAS